MFWNLFFEQGEEGEKVVCESVWRRGRKQEGPKKKSALVRTLTWNVGVPS